MQVEIKCRNCGSVQIIGQKYEELAQNQYAFLAAIATKDIYKEDPSPYIVDGTQSAFKILGFARDELIGREVRSLDPLMASGAYGNLWRLIVARNFKPFTLDVYQPKKDGMFVKARSRTVFQHTKNAMYLLSIFDPIDTSTRVPEQLSLPSNTDVKKMFCPFLLELDQNGVCDTASYEFTSLLGYLITDVVNQLFLNLYPKSLVEERKKLLFAMTSNRQSFRIQRDTLEDKNGRRHEFENCFTIRYTENGIFNGFSVALWPMLPEQ